MFIDRFQMFPVTQNNLYQTIPTLYKQWSLSIDIKPTGLVRGWANILHVGLGGDVSRYGDRSPGIWFNSMTTELLIVSAINGIKNFNFGLTPAIPMEKWTRVILTQIRQLDGSYQFTIIIAGEKFAQKTNNNPVDLSNVKVFTSDNFSYAAQAMITNPIIRTAPYEGKLNVMNKSPCTKTYEYPQAVGHSVRFFLYVLPINSHYLLVCRFLLELDLFNIYINMSNHIQFL